MLHPILTQDGSRSAKSLGAAARIGAATHRYTLGLRPGLLRIFTDSARIAARRIALDQNVARSQARTFRGGAPHSARPLRAASRVSCSSVVAAAGEGEQAAVPARLKARRRRRLPCRQKCRRPAYGTWPARPPPPAGRGRASRRGWGGWASALRRRPPACYSEVMAGNAAKNDLDVDAFLRWADGRQGRWELRDGRPMMMAGARRSCAHQIRRARDAESRHRAR